MERLSFFATRTEEEAMRETHNEPHSVRPGIADSTSLCFCKGEDDIANDDNSIVFQGKVIRGITAKEREFIKQNAGGNIWKYKGSISAVEFKKLILIKDTLGHVYNVVDPVEIYGVLYPAYTNFVCINAGTDDEPVYKWDSFGGTYPEATDTVPGIISKNQVRACIPIATLENNGLLSKEEFAAFMNKLDTADLLPYATKEEALPKKEISTRYLLPVHMDIDNLPNMTEGKSVIGNRTVVDVDTSKVNVATVTVSSPCYVYFYLLAYNKDQIPGGTIPMPYVLRYEVSCDKYNNGVYYSDGASQKTKGGCYACILFEVTDEMIQAEGGSVELNFYARCAVYPSRSINELGQILNVSLEIYNKYEYVKTQEYLEEHYYDKETADTKFIKVEERPTFATKEYVIKSYEENSTVYNNRSTANMLLVQNNKNLRNKHISEFGWRVDSDVQIPEGEFYLCAMENDSRIIGYSKEKLNLRNFINQNILFTFEEDIVFSEEATVNGFALIAEKVADNIYPIPTQNYPNMRPSANTNVTADKNVCMLVVNGNWKTTQMAPYHIKYYEYIKDIVNDGRLFIAEYGVTEYTEIKKAFDDKYNVICKKDNIFYNLLNVSSTIISFSTSNGTQLNNISVNNNNVWSYNVVPVENKNNKEGNTLTTYDTDKYPSSKAVADYISRQSFAKQSDLDNKQDVFETGDNLELKDKQIPETSGSWEGFAIDLYQDLNDITIGTGFERNERSGTYPIYRYSWCENKYIQNNKNTNICICVEQYGFYSVVDIIRPGEVLEVMSGLYEICVLVYDSLIISDTDHRDFLKVLDVKDNVYEKLNNKVKTINDYSNTQYPTVNAVRTFVDSSIKTAYPIEFWSDIYGYGFSIKNPTNYSNTHSRQSGIAIFGYKNNCEGYGTFVCGAYNNATANNSFITGYNNKATGNTSFSCGEYTTASGFYSFVQGYCSIATDVSSVALADLGVALGRGSLSKGSINAITAYFYGDANATNYRFNLVESNIDDIQYKALVFINNIIHDERGNFAKITFFTRDGDDVIITVNKTLSSSAINKKILYFGNSAYGADSVALNGLAKGDNSFAAGRNSFALGNYSFSLGNNCYSENDNEFSLGIYNVSTKSSDPAVATAFSIGNGTSRENRHNLLEIKQNGDIYLINGTKLQDKLSNEWYGTQEEFDALEEYDENVKYYIYD